MKTLITGGAGFIGSNLAAALCSAGHEVTVLDNLLSGYASNLAPLKEVRFVKGDVRDPQVVEHVVRDCEVVFHLAASVGNKRSIDNPRQDADINVLGTITLLDAARRASVRKIVVSSSAGIFGELKTLPIREDHPIEPVSPYGVSKLAEEKLCLAWGKLYGLEVVALRYFNVYGARQRFDAYGNVIPIFAHQILQGRPITIFGDGEQTRDFVNVRDVVRANMLAAQAVGVNGAFNLGGGTAISINALALMMIDVSGVVTPIQYGPPRAGDVRDSLADTTAAHAAFGFEPKVELRSGLSEYFVWLRELAEEAA